MKIDGGNTPVENICALARRETTNDPYISDANMDIPNSK
jgi:hypothetical protein